MFLLPFLTNNQLFAVVLIVFQGRYPRAIKMQPISQLQWTDIKTASKNDNFCSGKQQSAVRTDQKDFFFFLSKIFARW